MPSAPPAFIAVIVDRVLRNVAILVGLSALASLLITTDVDAELVVTRSAVAPLDVRESFADLFDGPTPVVESVEDFSYYASAAPTVRGGFLSTAAPDDAAGGSYRIGHLAGDVSTLGAEFAFSPYSRVGGVLCLSIQAESIATMPQGSVPVSPVHLVVTPTSWSVDVNAERGTGVEVVAGGFFAKPLAADGSTLHRAELVLDRAAGRVVLDLPDGHHVLEHPAFSLPGTFAYVEPFKAPGPTVADQTNALVSSWWAGASDAQTRPRVAEAPTVAAREVATPVQVAPAALPTVVAAPASPRKVRALRDGRRVVVTWRGQSDDYLVRCGRRSAAVDGQRAVVRSASQSCRVRAVAADAVSRWAVARVRS